MSNQGTLVLLDLNLWYEISKLNITQGKDKKKSIRMTAGEIEEKNKSQ